MFPCSIENQDFEKVVQCTTPITDNGPKKSSMKKNNLKTLKFVPTLHPDLLYRREEKCVHNSDVGTASSFFPVVSKGTTHISSVSEKNVREEEKMK